MINFRNATAPFDGFFKFYSLFKITKKQEKVKNFIKMTCFVKLNTYFDAKFLYILSPEKMTDWWSDWTDWPDGRMHCEIELDLRQRQSVPSRKHCEQLRDENILDGLTDA
jgi:hypothetical protein